MRLIDADELLENNTWDFFNEYGQYTNAGLAVKDAPTIEPKHGRWIPVTERLPKLGEKVLVSTKHTVFMQVFKCIYGTPDRWAWEHNTIKKVIAWMPLPEPYREVEE